MSVCRTARAIGVFGLLALCLSCGGGGGGGGGGTGQNPKLSQIVISPANPQVVKGSTVQLSATGILDNGNQESLVGVTWQTSQPSVAAISTEGMVTGMAEGSVQASAAYQGITGNTTITVGSPKLISVTVSPNQVSLPLGETEQFTASGAFSDETTQDLTQTATWSSSIAVASVNSTGTAVATAVGITTISATSGSLTGTASLSVTPAVIVALNVTPATLSLPLGSGIQLQAIATMSDGTQVSANSSVNWQTSQPSVTTVNSQGYATAVGKGNAQVSAVYQGITRSSSITVGPAALVGISVSPNQVSLPVGETNQLNASGTFTDGTSQDLTQSATWVSSNPANATVSPTGSAVAKAVGTVTISATSGLVTGSANLVVTPAAVVALNVVPATLSLPLGSSGQLQALATMSDGSTQSVSSSVTWQTSQSAFATVNPQGVVSAVGRGSAQVSATYQGVSGSAAITVGPAALVSVTVSPNQISLPVGETQQLSASGTFTDGTTQNLTQSATWVSSNPATATVSQAGSAVAKAVGAAMISATSGSVTGIASFAVTPAAVVALNIVPPALSLPLGSSSQLQALASMSDGTTQNLTTSATWTSTSTTNTVNAQGVVSAAGKGSAQVSAAYQGISGSTAITVGPAALVSIAVSPNQVSLPVGGTEQLTATGTFTDGTTQDLTQTATWISSGPTTATVSLTGSAVAKAVGTTTISATSGSVSGSASVVVTPAAVVALNSVPSSLSLPLGSSGQLQAMATMSDGTTQNVTTNATWSSTPTAVATVSQGAVTAAGKGAAQVSVGYQGSTGSASINVGAAALVSITVSPNQVSLPIGETQQLTASGTYTDGTTQNLTQSATWISSSPTTATVSPTGAAVAKAVGTATISATSGSVTGTASFVVTPAAVVAVNLVPSTLSLPLGSSGPLQALATMSDGTTQNVTTSATWSSTPLVVAAVNAQGAVTAVGKGAAQVSVAYQGITGSAAITVGPAALVSIAVSPNQVSLPVGEAQQLTATGTFTDGTTQDLTQSATWISSLPATATVSAAGSAVAKAVGTATISATSGSVTGTANVVVTPAVVVGLNIVPATLSLPLGSSSQLQAMATMSDGSTQNMTTSVTWSSTPSTVAAVNAQGSVTAAGKGAAQLSVAYQGITGSASITVGPPALVSIAISPTPSSLPAGETQQFAATGTFTDGSTQDLTSSATWSSSAPTIATISPAGLASALLVGSTTITAVSGTIQGTTTLTVTPAVLVSIAVSPVTPSIIAANTQVFTAKGTYSDGSTQDLTSTATWSSLAPVVATIAPGGLATGVAAGTSSISATVGSITGSTMLTVTTPVLLSIAVTPANPSIAAGSTQQFTATGTYNNGNTQDLTNTATWSSSAPAMATISNAPGSQGLAAALAVGTTTVQAVSGAISGSTTLTITAGFVLAGNENTARQYQTTTLLNTGMVLIAGGYGPSGALTSAELYNPTSGAFFPTGNLTTARGQHTATLLPNGMVLIAGGTGLSGNVASAELYNPATGAFTAIGSLNTARALHTATLLNTGMVLVAGGIDSTNLSLNSAELYNPATGTFTPDYSSLNTARALHTATLLNNGTVLFAGGNNPEGSAQTSAEVYDPVADIFTPTGVLNTGRYGHTATLLNNGLTLIVGGTGSGGAVASAELYDAGNAIFTPSGNLNTARFGHTTTLLNNGTALIAGGSTSGDFQTSAELYDPIAAAFTYTGSLNTGRYNHTATPLSSGLVLIVGGQGANGYLTIAELYEPGTSTPPNLVSIAVNPNSPTVPLDTAQQMIATGTFSDSSTQQLASVTWSSSNTAAVSITNDNTDSGEAYALGAGGTATVSACAGSVCGSTIVTVGPPALLSIAVTPANGSVPAGDSLNFDAVGTYSDGSTQDLTSTATWSSSATDVATITSGGQATGLMIGTSFISATAGSVTGSANLTVTPAVVVGLSVTPSTLFLSPGISFQMQAIATFSDGTVQDLSGSVTWSVKKSNIASVSRIGMVTAQQIGSTTISGQISGFTASASLTVVPITSVKVVPATFDMAPGTTNQYQAIATLSSGTTEDVSTIAAWSSTQSGFASVSSKGLVTAKQAGSTSILALVNGITGTGTLNVVAPTALNIIPAPLSMMLGSNRQLQAIATLTDGSTQNVTALSTWSSVQPSTVLVSSSGIATAEKIGSTTILASYSGLTASVNITVMPLLTLQYFNLSNAQASGADSIIRLTNTGLTGGDLCAMIYVFDSNQELNECCGCSISDDGMRTISLVNDLTANTLTGQKPVAGTIEVVSSDPTQNPQCDATSLAPTGQILAWGTNVQATTNGNYQVTESAFANSGMNSMQVSYLANLCSFMKQLGSGKGICTCGVGGK